jgi:3-oxoacyl-[acyl-carrier-protein] synthase-3
LINDEWITARTGIKERILRIVIGTSFLAIKAAQDLIVKANDPLEIDLVIMATADMPVASTGVYVATAIGATNAFSYDLQAACSSFFIWNVSGSSLHPIWKI